MTKAKAAISKAKADPRKWLSKELNERFKDFVDERKATLDPKKTNGVHDMRVAIRRLRSLITDFEDLIDVKPVKSVRKVLKKDARSLGKVRDQDVYIKALEKLRIKVRGKPHARAVTKLIEDSRKLRKEAYLRITKPLSKASLDDLSDEFSQAMDSALDKSALSRPAKLTAAARQAVEARLKKLGKCGRNIYDPADQKGLHKFRIAVKRLRYSMEAFAPVLNGSLRPLAERAATLQSLLGDIHDCDVWINRLAARLKKIEKNDKGSAADLGVLSLVESKLVKRRTKRYRAALELWSEWETSNFLQKIDSAVSKN